MSADATWSAANLDFRHCALDSDLISHAIDTLVFLPYILHAYAQTILLQLHRNPAMKWALARGKQDTFSVTQYTHIIPTCYKNIICIVVLVVIYQIFHIMMSRAYCCNMQSRSVTYCGDLKIRDRRPEKVCCTHLGCQQSKKSHFFRFCASLSPHLHPSTPSFAFE